MNDKKEGSVLNKKTITLTAMMLINVSAVLTLRSIPSEAAEGYSVIFYLICGAILFFIPSALISAELASTYPQKGGVYLWVKEAFGPKWGFLAIFMQWMENMPWFPSMITFIAAAVAFMFDPSLANNKLFVFVFVNVLFWGCTFINLKGQKWTNILSSTGATAGVIIPGAILIISGIVFLALGHKPEVTFTAAKLIPNFSNKQKLLELVVMLVGLSGIEMSAVHVTEMKNPKKQFPKAILLAALLIVIINILAALAMVFVTPTGKLSASQGIFYSFRYAFDALHISWATPILYILIAFGSFASVATWLIGPSKGLLEAAKDGYLPEKWQKTNKAGAPSTILIIQGVIVSLLSLSILFTKSVNDAFLMMSSLTALLYMTMYILMFAAAIRLRYTQPAIERPYKVPGGNVGIWILGLFGITSAVLSFVFGFLPPDNVKTMGAKVGYYIFMAGGYIVLFIIPFVLYRMAMKRKAANREAIETSAANTDHAAKTASAPKAAPASKTSSAPKVKIPAATPAVHIK